MAAVKGTLAGAFVSLVSATVNLAIVFGWTLTVGQRAAVIAEATAIAAVAPIVGVVIDHSKRQANARLTAAAQIANK